VFPRSEFMILGDGQLREQLQELARSFGITEKVIFRGSVPHDELPSYLNSSDLYVSTSLSDGTSISLLEAMACGLPCVVSDIPANKPWIKEGQNGFRFQPGDHKELATKIISVLSGKELRASMGVASRLRVVEEGDHKTEMSKVEQVYVRLIKEIKR